MGGGKWEVGSWRWEVGGCFALALHGGGIHGRFWLAMVVVLPLSSGCVVLPFASPLIPAKLHSPERAWAAGSLPVDTGLHLATSTYPFLLLPTVQFRHPLPPRDGGAFQCSAVYVGGENAPPPPTLSHG